MLQKQQFHKESSFAFSSADDCVVMFDTSRAEKPAPHLLQKRGSPAVNQKRLINVEEEEEEEEEEGVFILIPVAKETSSVRVPSLTEMTLVLALSTLCFLLGAAWRQEKAREGDGAVEVEVVVAGTESRRLSDSSYSTSMSSSLFISTNLDAHSIVCVCVCVCVNY